MANDHGRANAFTVLSHIKSDWGVVLLWVVLRVLHFLKRSQKTAKSLRFLHFARWTIVTNHGLLDRLGRTPPRKLEKKLLVFCTNYNGDWEDYIGSFSRVLSLPLNTVWRRCVGFPGAKPEAALKGYIRQNAHDSEFFHSAYPESSVHDVRESIELYERFEDLYDTEVGYEEFLARTQHGLGSKRAADAVRAGG